MTAQVYRAAAIQAAQIAGGDPAMDTAAAKVAARARALAAGHRLSGDYLSGIGTERIAGKRGVVDRIAYVDDPAAAHIEFGHMTRRSAGTAGQPRWVDGLRIFTRAANL